jgi:hypothetical protein
MLLHIGPLRARQLPGNGPWLIKPHGYSLLRIDLDFT